MRISHFCYLNIVSAIYLATVLTWIGFNGNINTVSTVCSTGYVLLLSLGLVIVKDKI